MVEASHRQGQGSNCTLPSEWLSSNQSFQTRNMLTESMLLNHHPQNLAQMCKALSHCEVCQQKLSPEQLHPKDLLNAEHK